MLQKIDGARLAAIGRARHAWEVRKRLGYPEAKAKLKRIAIVEQRVRNGEPEPVKPRREIKQAAPITEDQIQCYQVHTRGTWRWWR